MLDKTPVNFDHLSPDFIINSVESCSQKNMTPLINPLPSYINRVYELESEDGERIIAKFYRPGRWNKEALLEEQQFCYDCAEQEIPVVPPWKNKKGEGLFQVSNTYFALFPKKSGRLFESNSDEDYLRAGALIGRMHLAGKQKKASARITMHPDFSLDNDIIRLENSGHIKGALLLEFISICRNIQKIIQPLFEDCYLQRVHGDCHRGNILQRPGEGLMLIDFDDMATGPPVQDLWMLLPEHLSQCRREMEILIEGYQNFCPFDYSWLKLIEALRAMRIIYFLSWCSIQTTDASFNRNFPNWGSDSFWREEIQDLEKQLSEIKENIN